MCIIYLVDNITFQQEPSVCRVIKCPPNKFCSANNFGIWRKRAGMTDHISVTFCTIVGFHDNDNEVEANHQAHENLLRFLHQSSWLNDWTVERFHAALVNPGALPRFPGKRSHTAVDPPRSNLSSFLKLGRGKMDEMWRSGSSH